MAKKPGSKKDTKKPAKGAKTRTTSIKATPATRTRDPRLPAPGTTIMGVALRYFFPELEKPDASPDPTTPAAPATPA